MPQAIAVMFQSNRSSVCSAGSPQPGIRAVACKPTPTFCSRATSAGRSPSPAARDRCCSRPGLIYGPLNITFGKGINPLKARAKCPPPKNDVSKYRVNVYFIWWKWSILACRCISLSNHILQTLAYSPSLNLILMWFVWGFHWLVRRHALCNDGAIHQGI